MLKSISKVGTVLNKSEQQSINGGNGRCYSNSDCGSIHCPAVCIGNVCIFL